MTIDTLKLSKGLESAGMPRTQAEQVASAVDDALSGNGLAEVRRDLKGIAERVRHLESDGRVLKWMAGANLALTLLVLGRLFAH